MHHHIIRIKYIIIRYTVAAVISGSIWKKLFSKDPLNKETGKKYWNNVFLYYLVINLWRCNGFNGKNRKFIRF